jgi:hypothetical protein
MKGHRQIITYLLLTIFVLLSTAAVALSQDTVMNTGQERDTGFWSLRSTYISLIQTSAEAANFVWTGRSSVPMQERK